MIRLTTEAFDPGAALTDFCRDRDETGAVVSFVGLARAEGGAAAVLELDAWPGFTDARIGEIVAGARRRFDLQDVTIIHRIGKMAAGEAIVLLLVAAAHRRAAFEGCDYLMDYLKSRAPFWKKEHGPTGSRWIEPTAGDLADLGRWGEEPTP